jgi:prenyltransferase beta subunit
MLTLKQNPFQLILNQGSPATILQVLKLLDRLETSSGFKNLLHLISLQNDDSGFPNNLERGNPSSVKITYRATRTLTQIGVSKDSHTIVSAVNWLIKQQEKDGGWHENPTIALPKWVTWESTRKSVTWYTCQIATLLHELGMEKTDTFRKTVSFLEKAEMPNGGWPSVVGSKQIDPDTTVEIGNFLAKIHGPDYPPFLRVKKMFEEQISALAKKIAHETVDDAYELTHLVRDEVPNYMYSVGDKRVKKSLKMLIQVQREDGGWKTFYSGGKSDVAITVYALQVLVSHKIIRKTTLQTMFDHAMKNR